MKITGELLKTERLKLHLSQQDIASALKLSPRTIQAIEDGNLELLPAKTFVRGFVKSYAEMLKLDSVLVLKQFHEEVGLTQPKSKIAQESVQTEILKISKTDEIQSQNKNISTVTPQLKNNLNGSTFKIVALILGMVLALGGINQIINKYQKEVQPAAEEVAQPNEKNTPTEKNTEPSVTANMNIIPENEKISANPNASMSSDITDSKQVKIEPKVESVENNTNESKKNDEKSIELVLEALKNTTVSYAVGNETTYKSIDLKKDTFQIIKSKNGLKIKTDDGSSINITVNGVNKGAASKDAKPIQITF